MKQKKDHFHEKYFLSYSKATNSLLKLIILNKHIETAKFAYIKEANISQKDSGRYNNTLSLNINLNAIMGKHPIEKDRSHKPCMNNRGEVIFFLTFGLNHNTYKEIELNIIPVIEQKMAPAAPKPEDSSSIIM